jgi:hypothetical protein
MRVCRHVGETYIVLESATILKGSGRCLTCVNGPTGTTSRIFVSLSTTENATLSLCSYFCSRFVSKDDSEKTWFLGCNRVDSVLLPTEIILKLNLTSMNEIVMSSVDEDD